MRERFIARLFWALLAGAVTFVAVSFVTGGIFPFIEFIAAAVVVYFVARR